MLECVFKLTSSQPMFKIGEIYVPKDLFEKLKDEIIGGEAEAILRLDDGHLPENVREKLVALEAKQWLYPEKFQYLAALIRIQMDDYVRSYNEIERSEEFKNIVHAARQQAENEISQIILEMLPTDYTLLTSITEELGINFSSGQQRQVL